MRKDDTDSAPEDGVAIGRVIAAVENKQAAPSLKSEAQAEPKEAKLEESKTISPGYLDEALIAIYDSKLGRRFDGASSSPSSYSTDDWDALGLEPIFEFKVDSIVYASIGLSSFALRLIDMSRSGTFAVSGGRQEREGNCLKGAIRLVSLISKI